MRRLRRNLPEPRIELIPLIDVMMFLVTFFIYAMMLMVRVELLPIDLQTFQASKAAKREDAVVIHIDLDGQVLLGSEPVGMDDLLPRLRMIQQAKPDAVIYLAMAAGEGTLDRGPVLTALWDRLKDAGMKINFVGAPKDKPRP